MLVSIVHNIEEANKSLKENTKLDAILVAGCQNCTATLVVIEGPYSADLHEVGAKVRGDIHFHPIYHTRYCFLSGVEGVKELIKAAYNEVRFEETACA